MISYQSWNTKDTWVGLSTDEKPVKDIPNGAYFWEMDTTSVYMFDKENSAWNPQMIAGADPGGGGGGSYVLPVATKTKLGGVKADKSQAGDTKGVYVDPKGFLHVSPDVLVVQATQEGGAWKADVGSETVRSFTGEVILKADVDGTPYVYRYQRYGTVGAYTGAVFDQPNIQPDAIERIEVVVDRDRNVYVVRTPYKNPIPPIGPDDVDKVLTAGADQTPEWRTPSGGGGGKWRLLDSIDFSKPDNQILVNEYTDIKNATAFLFVTRSLTGNTNNGYINVDVNGIQHTGDRLIQVKTKAGLNDTHSTLDWTGLYWRGRQGLPSSPGNYGMDNSMKAPYSIVIGGAELGPATKIGLYISPPDKDYIPKTGLLDIYAREEK